MAEARSATRDARRRLPFHGEHARAAFGLRDAPREAGEERAAERVDAQEALAGEARDLRRRGLRHAEHRDQGQRAAGAEEPLPGGEEAKAQAIGRANADRGAEANGAEQTVLGVDRGLLGHGVGRLGRLRASGGGGEKSRASAADSDDETA